MWREVTKGKRKYKPRAIFSLHCVKGHKEIKKYKKNQRNISKFEFSSFQKWEQNILSIKRRCPLCSGTFSRKRKAFQWTATFSGKPRFTRTFTAVAVLLTSVPEPPFCKGTRLQPQCQAAPPWPRPEQNRRPAQSELPGCQGSSSPVILPSTPSTYNKTEWEQTSPPTLRVVSPCGRLSRRAAGSTDFRNTGVLRSSP